MTWEVVLNIQKSSSLVQPTMVVVSKERGLPIALQIISPAFSHSPTYATFVHDVVLGRIFRIRPKRVLPVEFSELANLKQTSDFA